MKTVTFKISFWMFALLIVGALAPLSILPLIPELEWPPQLVWWLTGVSAFMVAYAITLFPTRMVVSDHGLLQKQIFSELKLSWSDITEWRYDRNSFYPDFWIKDKQGKRYQLKRWLIYGERRSMQLVEVLRNKGIAGREENDY